MKRWIHAKHIAIGHFQRLRFLLLEMAYGDSSTSGHIDMDVYELLKKEIER